MADPVISPPEVAFASPLEHSRRQLEALLEVSEASPAACTPSSNSTFLRSSFTIPSAT